MSQSKSSRLNALPFVGGVVPLSSKSWDRGRWLNVLTHKVQASPRVTLPLGLTHGIKRTDDYDGLGKKEAGFLSK
jgi:hypothetical protein